MGWTWSYIPVAEPSGCLVYVISWSYSLLLADPEIWDSPALQCQTISGFRSGQLICKGGEEECPAEDNNVSAINWQQLNNRYIYIYIYIYREIRSQKLSFRNLKSFFFSWTKTTKRIIEQIHTTAEDLIIWVSFSPNQNKAKWPLFCSSCQSAFTKGHTWHQTTTWMHCSGSVHISHKSLKILS
jgi:hypothetical protein